MATYETNSLGFPLKFSGPESVDEYDKKAGRVGACLEDAIDNTIYRSTLPEWQDAFATEVEQLTGEKRQVDTERTQQAKTRSKNPDKVADILETVKKFINRATAGMSKADKTALATTAQECADKIVIDPSPSKRAAGPGKDLLSKADSILTGNSDEIETKVTKFLGKVPDFELQRDDNEKPDRVSLARLIGKYVDAMLAEE